jgi:hypothetical protein
MFRTRILTAALGLAALTGLSLTPTTARAAPPVGHFRPPFFGRYEVLVRHHGHWDKVGTFRDRDDARRAARQYRMRGLEVKIERC